MIEFWIVENTGWSGGVSWFICGGTHMNPLRFKSEEEALRYLQECKSHYSDPSTLWRYVHTTITRTDDSETIHKQFYNIK